MKKMLLCFSICTFAFVLGGCADIDNFGHTEYVYVNESSSEITLHLFRPLTTGEIYELQFIIPVKGKLSLIDTGLYQEPFTLGDISYDLVTVSNGEKKVTQKDAERGELFLTDSYILISDKNNLVIFQYVFTDEFFENGDPVK